MTGALLGQPRFEPLLDARSDLDGPIAECGNVENVRLVQVIAQNPALLLGMGPGMGVVNIGGEQCCLYGTTATGSSPILHGSPTHRLADGEAVPRAHPWQFGQCSIAQSKPCERHPSDTVSVVFSDEEVRIGPHPLGAQDDQPTVHHVRLTRMPS